eukprot:SAG31_NODE_19439_length_602_cov_0.765408_2_plen_34_part_01
MGQTGAMELLVKWELDLRPYIWIIWPLTVAADAV